MAFFWRLIERRLRRVLPPEHVQPALGDLMQDHAVRRGRRGRVGAALWLARECRSLTRAYGNRRLPGAARQRSLVDVAAFDLRQAWSTVRARPAATLATAAVLTLGIGLVSAMFALADPYLFRPLPYPRPLELAAITLNARPSGRPLPNLSAWEARTDLFVGAAAFGDAQAITVSAGDAEAVVQAMPVSRSFFPLLGLRSPAVPDWTASDSETPVVITASLARRLFPAGDPLGRLLPRVDGGGLRVAGVLPESFLFPSGRRTGAIAGLVPLADQPLAHVQVSPSGRGFSSSNLWVLARLREGVTPEIVEAALSVPGEGSRPILGVSVERLSTQLTKRQRPAALGALVAGMLILLVSAANVANLLLARGAYRTREFAAREALGATRGDLARLVLAELAVLTTLGIAGGLALAHVALALSALVIPAEYIALGEPSVTLRVAGFAAAAGVFVMLTGLVPAMAARRVAPRALFNQTSAVESRLVRTLRFSMTAAQCAVAIVLLAGAALLGHSYVNLMTQESGLGADSFSVRVLYPAGRSGDALQHDIERTLARLRSIPDVRAAGATSGSLLDGSISMSAGGVLLNGRRVRGQAKPVTAGFFEAAGAVLVAGRLPTDADRGRAAVVNESFARECCETGSPIGLVIERTQPVQIVGIVRDMRDTAFDRPAVPMVFTPLTPAPGVGTPMINFVFRAHRPDRALAPRIEREIRAINRQARVSEGLTLGERLMQSINDRSFATLMVAFFALAAVGVTVAGLAGVVSFLVARRTREIAIRMAIGASGVHVRRLVMREAAIAAGTGIVLGFAAGLWLSRSLESLLYGVEPADPVTLSIAVAAMIGLVAIAAWIPARRAMRLSPSDALRTE